MNPEDLRAETLQRALAGTGKDQAAGAGNGALAALTAAWLESVHDDDLAGLEVAHLLAPLGVGFTQLARWKPQEGCRIAAFSYANGHGAQASALLILNPDMPFLVDSIVMAMRRLAIPGRAVLNAVLAVQRYADGEVRAAGKPGQADGDAESWVLCLMAESLAPEELEALQSAVRMAALDAATVQRDALALRDRMAQVAHGAGSGAGGGQEQEEQEEAAEVAAFLEWARGGGFECFGYAHYQVVDGRRELEREQGSALGVLVERSHPVYGNCLAGIPGDLETLAARRDTLSVVKADVQSTLHRDQQLDFIGVRERTGDGKVVGEHCFVGLFSRAGAVALPQMPFARQRIKQVLALAGVRNEGFRAEKFVEILESLPRTEVLEADPAWLAQVCNAVVALYKQPRARIFARRDVYGRHLNVLAYIPRERYGTHSTKVLAQELQRLSGARDVRVQTLLADGPLARVYLIASGAAPATDIDTAIRRPLLQVVEGWHAAYDRMVDGTGDALLRRTLRTLRAQLPTDYINACSAEVAYRDLCMLASGSALNRVRVRIEIGADALASIRLLSVDAVPPLSAILPALQNAGVAVLRERTHAIVTDRARWFVSSLSVDAPAALKLAQAAEAAQEMFEALFNDEAEDGRMNALSIEAGLRVKEVQLVRAYASYWRQAGARFSLRYIAERLKTQPVRVRALVTAFQARFDPARTTEERTAALQSLQEFRQSLADIDHADTEDILRSLAELMSATLRTSYFQPDRGDTIAFKFDSSQLALLPQPRPWREIYVFARRFEGVHLRGGPVARGGLRWSDRMEDYRTEVLGLVKAQMVKNAVIVPAGAKGGFVCKMIPKDAPREVVAAEGVAVYRLFIGGLLDLTDNRVQGALVPPPATVCHDEADPYLVVAADKGTASFSDVANGIAVARNFWLGDAFASGGSNGYDHKKLGITARGAWEAARRHLYELGHDMRSTPLRVIGVGDMSGDVFGNGMLLSDRLQLVAAFDHRHIFIDPNPDPAVSFAERSRLFALPRSSWDDYDRALISPGGGVWPRHARRIALPEQIRAALGIEEDSLAPEELMNAILRAPVDLFYNGGIGTYIKASGESHEQVKDRANDAIRVDGAQLRCKVVVEGGNLGVTQAGRVEFALAGGRIFTDAIDNSAGVDCSDHEVNLKIWLDAEIASGKLDIAERNRLLEAATPEVVALVLRDNALQTQLLTREAEAQTDPAAQDGYAALIAHLEAEGQLSRRLEQLPGSAQLAQRRQQGRGLTAPELAVVVAHAKNRYKRLLAQSDLLRYSWARALLEPYFPASLRAGREPLAHPLANAILATVLANEAVNRCGPLMPFELARARGVAETEVLCAWAQGWHMLKLAPHFATLDQYALTVPLATAREVERDTRVLPRSVTSGVLAMPIPQQPDQTAAQLDALFAQPELLAGGQGQALPTSSLSSSDLPPAFAQAAAALAALGQTARALFAALVVAASAHQPLGELLRLTLALRHALGIERLEQALMQGTARAEAAALREQALQALSRGEQRLLLRVLQQEGRPDDIDASLAALPVLTAALAAPAGAPLASFEQAVLQAWKLAEAAGAD